MERPRLLLADDHMLVVEGLRKLLEDDFSLVGAAPDGRALLADVAKIQPDAVLLDISMPVLNGIEAARQLKQAHPGIKVIFLTMHADPEYVREAFRAGASGYVLKRSAASELVSAIREVLAGRPYVTPFITKEALGRLLAAKDRPGSTSSRLSTRQREVLQLVAEGHAAKEIAAILSVSVKTVEYHKSGIMQKLGLRTTAELTRFAIEHGIVGI